MCIYIYHIFLNHSSVDEHLGCFHVLPIINNAANAGDIRVVSLIPGLEISPGEEMATYSSILAWKMPWKEEADGLQSMGSQRVGYD